MGRGCFFGCCELWVGAVFLAVVNCRTVCFLAVVCHRVGLFFGCCELKGVFMFIFIFAVMNNRTGLCVCCCE